jgi:RND family efflux transporter MFP subunit
MKFTLFPTFALLAAVLTGCGRAPEPKPAAALPTASVRAQKVETQRVPVLEEVVGTVRSRLRAAVEAKVSGRIVALPVIAGQSLAEGDLIAQLDAREIQARLDQAKAALENADRDLQRYATLLQQQVLTRAEFDAAEARQRMARAAVTEAETMLDYARVAAPFAGVVTRKLAEVGDLATPGRVIVEMEDPKTLRVEADVPEALIEFVRVGAVMNIHAPGLTAPLAATVSELSPAADPNSRTFPVKLDLPANAPVRLGQFVRVAVPVGEADALRVPTRAVVVRGQMEMVFVVTNGAAQLRLVKMGKRTGDTVEIVSGLSAGESIVVEGAAQLRDGQPVQIGN